MLCNTNRFAKTNLICLMAYTSKQFTKHQTNKISFFSIYLHWSDTFISLFPHHFSISQESRIGQSSCVVIPRSWVQIQLAATAIAEIFWKLQRKTWYSILGLDAKPLFLYDDLLKTTELSCMQKDMYLWEHQCTGSLENQKFERPV